MPHPTIAIDLDDVISPFVPELMVWYNQMYQGKLCYEHFTSYDFSKIWGLTQEQSVIICDTFHHSRTVQDIQPIENAVKALTFLKQRFTLVLVTSRPLQHTHYTHAWINHHLPNIFTDIILCNHWTTMGQAIKKSDVCKKINARYFIDDLPFYVEEVASCSIPSLLFGDYPWNKNISPLDNVQRVSGWNEVMDYFNHFLP